MTRRAAEAGSGKDGRNGLHGEAIAQAAGQRRGPRTAPEGVRDTARLIWKSLGKLRNDARAANRLAKKSFLFKDRSSHGANFCKFFLGRIEGNQRVAGEKIWIRVFPGRRLRSFTSAVTRRCGAFAITITNFITYSDNQKAFDAMESLIPCRNQGFCGMNEGMNRRDILDRLRENERALRARGVTHAALFGSVARGEQRPDSDIDILVDLDPAIVVTMFDYAGLKDYIAGLFQGSVDVVDREALKPRVRPKATADAVYAF
jgi:uncharacterized protein